MSKQIPLFFELHDIFEDIVFDENYIPQNDCHILKSNIEYILRREKLWNKDLIVIFPMGSLKNIDMENDFYQYDFSIYSEVYGEYIAHGICFGAGILFESKNKSKPVFEIVDMEIDIREYDLNKLKGNEKCKERVIFT